MAVQTTAVGRGDRGVLRAAEGAGARRAVVPAGPHHSPKPHRDASAPLALGDIEPLLFGEQRIHEPT